MGFFTELRNRRTGLFLAIAIGVAAFTSPSAYAMKNRTIVLRATGSGAILGLGAGLVSYPFAKSTGTIIAGALVGAILGTVYGFYLVDLRDRSYQSASLEDLYALNEARNGVLLRGRPPRAEVFVPVSVFEF